MLCGDQEIYDAANGSAVILKEQVYVSLSKSRNAGSRGEDRPDAPVLVVVRQQSPLLQVSQSGAPDQVALTPLCTDTRCFWSISLVRDCEILANCCVIKLFKTDKRHKLSVRSIQV